MNLMILSGLFPQVLSKSKPTYDPERDMSFEKYFDEYYKLDFEDVVGGMPTRFKYRQVIQKPFRSDYIG